MYVRNIGLYLCFSMANNWVWVGHVEVGGVDNVGVGETCRGGWSVWG